MMPKGVERSLSESEIISKQTAGPFVRFRRKAAQGMIAGGFSSLACLGSYLPIAKAARHNVERVRNVRYGDPDEPTHVLDVYRPMNQTGLRPVVIYIHGGGFQHMSKDSHWLMGLAYARRGYVVFSINYRLAPAHPFPAGMQDAVRAFDWVAKNAEQWGGDAGRMILAGESAGANFAAALTIAHCFEPVADWARPVFDAPGVNISAVIPACGVFQVNDVARLFNDKRAHFVVRDVLSTIEGAYLKNGLDPVLASLANPLLQLESDEQPVRPLPPFCLPVGGGDALAQDHERMEAALIKRGVPVEAKVYGRQPHAFHAFVWTKIARQCWNDQFAFLAAHGVSADGG